MGRREGFRDRQGGEETKGQGERNPSGREQGTQDREGDRKQGGERRQEVGLGVGKGDRCDHRDSRQHEQSMKAGWRWGCAKPGPHHKSWRGSPGP